ncbi:MAG: dihydrodipicolinate reductase [Pseudomonadota bacterium]
MRSFFVALAVSMLAMPALADGFSKVEDRTGFVQLIEDKKLTRFGIKLTVTPGGQIKGKAFGVPVTGAWEWNAGYFCRDLYWGKRDLGANCQEVMVQGETLRFTSDRGNGQFADLVLK